MENSARLSGSSATITSASTWRIAATAWTIAVIIQTKNRNNARTNVADAIDSSATIAATSPRKTIQRSAKTWTNALRSSTTARRFASTSKVIIEFHFSK